MSLSDDERLRALARQSAKAEPLYWTEGVLTDRYGRPLAKVQEELATALDLAEQLGVIVSKVEALTAGRVYGPTLPRRLRSSIESLVRLAEWNTRVTAALEQAWLEEAEKQP